MEPLCLHDSLLIVQKRTIVEMASSGQMREWYSSYRCNTDKMVRVPIWGGGDKYWQLLVADVTVPAWKVFNNVLEHFDYPFVESAGGTYVCRFIGGTTTYSLHAYGLALDINPSKNKFGGPTEDDYPDGFVEALEDVTIDGVPVFQWGGRWSNDDDMHWQINVPPDADWNNIKGGEGMAHEDVGAQPGVDPVFATVWQEMLDEGVFSQYTDPDDVPRMEELAAFLSRYTVKVVKDEIAKNDNIAVVDPHARSLATRALNTLQRIKDAI